MAKDRASSTDVKQFAQMMIDDHTKAGNELKQIATSNNITPEGNASKDQDLRNKLSSLKGADFDREYMKAMVDDHEKAVRQVRSRVDENRSLNERLTGKNPENPATVKPEQSSDPVKMRINQWAANTLPTIEQHLDRAKTIKDTLDHTSRTTRGTAGTNAPAATGTSKY